MASIGFSSVTFTRRAAFAGSPVDGTVVWLRGVHDVSTVDALTEILALAVGLDDADLTVDLSGVEFMCVATVGVIVRSREFLRLRSRLLALRSASMCARRALKQAVPFYGCVVGDDRTRALTGTAGSLGTWVAVPRRGARVDGRAEVFASTPSNAPDPIGLGRVAVSRRGASIDVHSRAEGRITTVARRAGS